MEKTKYVKPEISNVLESIYRPVYGTNGGICACPCWCKCGGGSGKLYREPEQ